MEFKIKRKDFLEGLSYIQGVVEKKNTMPILSNILLEAMGSALKISATDLEVASSCEATAQVLKEGKITVLAKSIQDIVRETDQEELKISLGENDRIELVAGTARFKIPGLNASEFPTFPAIDVPFVTVQNEELRQMLDRSSFAMANDETRYNLNGVLFQKSGQARMVATDGHRLAMVERGTVLQDIADFSVIIPKKGVAELKKIVSGEGVCEVAIGKKGLMARKGNISLYVRYLDGEFPQFEAVIPKDNNIVISVPKAALVGALRRVSLLSNERSKGVVLAFTSGNLEISAVNPDLGEAHEELAIDYRGQKLNVGFNARYLLDVLDVVKDEKVLLGFKAETAPCLIKSEFDVGFQSVIMPMRI